MFNLVVLYEMQLSLNSVEHRLMDTSYISRNSKHHWTNSPIKYSDHKPFTLELFTFSMYFHSLSLHASRITKYTCHFHGYYTQIDSTTTITTTTTTMEKKIDENYLFGSWWHLNISIWSYNWKGQYFVEVNFWLSSYNTGYNAIDFWSSIQTLQF